MIKISRTKFKINELGEIDNRVTAVVKFETLDLNSFEELVRYEKLLKPKAQFLIYYSNGKRELSITSKESREYVRLI